MKKLVEILLISLFCFTILYSNEEENYSKLTNYLVNEYSIKYEIDKDDVTIKLFHIPDINFDNLKIQLINKSKSLKLGHNRANLQLIKNNKVQQEIQVTFKAKIEIYTPVVSEMIKFGNEIKSSELVLEKREIKYNYNEYFRTKDLEKGLVAKTLLRKGNILKKTDVRFKPTINRGQQIDLVVKSGNIRIEMDGIAKEDGSQGEKIRVYNQRTRKHYFGIVESPQTVVINIE